MTAFRRLASFAIGFALATFVAAVLGASAARSQTRFDTIVTPAPRQVEIQRRRAGAPPVLSPEPFQTTVQPSASAQRPAVDPDAEPADGEEDEADQRQPQLRPGTRDGDFADPPPTPVVDGPADARDPAAPVDGVDPATIDQRQPEDIDAFERPPAGFDPLLFQIEVEPILDRRPARLFRFEPYDPIGVRVGKFIVLPEIEIAGLWNSNVLRSRSARSDVALDIRPSVRVVSNWKAHALEFRARGGLSYFNELSSEDDRTYTIESRGRIDLSRRTNFEGLVSRDVSQESRSSIDAVQTSGGRRSNIQTDRAVVALNHRFNRLSLQLRGSVNDLNYGATEDVSTGQPLRVRLRDHAIYEEAVRATWEFKPTLLAFVETAINQRDYEQAVPGGGIRRDGTGERFRIGIGFGNASQRLRGEASVGYGRQNLRDSRLADVDGVLFDANLAYRWSAFTTFLVTAGTEINETTLANSGGSLAHRIGYETRYAMQRNLILTSGTTLSMSDYAGVDLKEREIASGVGLEYFVDRDVILFGRYQHTKFDSNQSGRDYNADEIRIGMRLRQ